MQVNTMRPIMYLAAGLFIAGAVPLSAQSSFPTEVPRFAVQAPPAARPAPAARTYLRAYFLFDSTSMAAAETFDAVIGTSRLSMAGAGGEALGLWKGLFARVAFSTASETGHRVDVFEDEVVSVGIPITVELRPIEVAGGWRLRPVASGRLVPYFGGGLLRMGYRETSDFADTGENIDTSFTGAVMFGGIEASLVSWIVAGAEVQYRTVPDAIGGGGVSQVFGEDNLGGLTFRVLFGVRR
jgi:hypothetical protein